MAQMVKRLPAMRETWVQSPGQEEPLGKAMTIHSSTLAWDSLVAQTVKRLAAMRETWVQSPGREDPLEKEMAPHFSTLA